jgi:N-hydroxyarylamine O-acetyltransferase
LSELSDDWSVGQLDLDAYLRRIAYQGPTEPSAATLTALYRAHLAQVPFENFDIFLTGRVSVDLEDIQEKIVFRGRGGYCYEHVQLLGAALERLGFGVERLLGRVGPDGLIRRRTHLVLRVRDGQRAWLADPGFGSSPPVPLSLEGDPAGRPQEADGWTYEVVPDNEQGQAVWKLREYRAGSWVTLHRWEDSKVHPIDVDVANYYVSTHPDSWFTWQPIIVKRAPGAIASILGRTHTVTRPGHVKTRSQLTDKEFAAALTEEFGLTLTSDELDVLVKAPTGHSEKSVLGTAPGT